MGDGKKDRYRERGEISSIEGKGEKGDKRWIPRERKGYKDRLRGPVRKGWRDDGSVK